MAQPAPQPPSPDPVVAEWCATAEVVDAAAKAAVAASLLNAVLRLEAFDPVEAEQLLEDVALCCDLLAELERDDRALMAARLAYAARLMSEHDPELARELDRLMDLCGDQVIEATYGAARGTQDGTGAGAPGLFPIGGGGGGVPSDN